MLQQQTAEAAEGDGDGTVASASAAPAMGQYTLKFGSIETLREFVAMVERYKKPQPQSAAVTAAACATVDAIASSIV